MTLEALLRGLWRRKGALLLWMLVLYAAAAAVVWTWPRRFVASAIVAPAETTGLATSSWLTPGPLLQASLLDSRPNGNFAVYLAALRAPEAAAMLARDTPILPALEARRNRPPLGALRAALGLRLAADADDVLAFLERSLAATASTASVTWTLELVHEDAALARDMLARLHAQAEAQTRAHLAEQAARRVAALEARVAGERDLYLRQALFDLLAQQQRAALVVAADQAVAARLVSAPVAELRPSTPNRPLLLLLLAVAVPGFVLVLAASRLLLRGAPAPAPWGAQARGAGD
ncbi:hypothetical protein ACI6QG_12880 [Roseococcus sp. DSY-14]|uniref:hypothetical protein n=1 Tax=Roseococcus sp. DSY-14 TaxID=3369650 RepID=UPI00387ADACB